MAHGLKERELSRTERQTGRRADRRREIERGGWRASRYPRTATAHCDVLRQKLGVTRWRHIRVAYRLVTGRAPCDAPARGRDAAAGSGHVRAERVLWTTERSHVLYRATGTERKIYDGETGAPLSDPSA